MKVLVILPTYNERENLSQIVRAIVAHGYRVMVVDDQSPDGTGAIADDLVREFPGRVEVVHRTGPRGLGRSYVEGMGKALEGDADLICQMDADFSHDPKYLPDLVAAAATNDLVIGSRYLQGISVVNWPLHRLVLSVLANRYIRGVIRVRVHDCTSGFRCWRRDMLARIPLNRIVSEGYAFIVETMYEAARLNARIGEVPIIFVERRLGTSKLSKAVLIESLITPWRVVARGFFGPKPHPAERA